MSEYNPLAQYDKIYAPAFEKDGHAQHNLVAEACNGIATERYLTYTSAGKSTSSREVKIERPEWIAKKLRAMACYESQMSLDPRMGCWPHFVRGIQEYYL